MKNIDRTPDITSDEYWDSHHIAVVKIDDLTPTPAEPHRLEVRHRVVQSISRAPVEPARTTPLRFWRFLGDPDRASRVAAGDSAVVFYPRNNPADIAAIPLETSAEQSPLVNRLNRIARLRSGEGGADALFEAAFDPDRDVALYSLKRLVKQEARELDRASLARLRALADAPAADPEVRMLAEQLVTRTARGGGAEQEFAWLRTALSDARGPDWTRLRVLALRMLDFPDRRMEAAEALTALVKDRNEPLDARIAAYSVFEDARLFPSDRTDAVTELVFATVEQMARSPEEPIHQAGAVLLHNLTTKVTPEQQSAFAARATAVLQSALAGEKSAVSAHHIQRSLDLLSRRGPEP